MQRVWLTQFVGKQFPHLVRKLLRGREVEPARGYPIKIHSVLNRGYLHELLKCRIQPRRSPGTGTADEHPVNCHGQERAIIHLTVNRNHRLGLNFQRLGTPGRVADVEGSTGKRVGEHPVLTACPAYSHLSEGVCLIPAIVVSIKQPHVRHRAPHLTVDGCQ